MARGSIVSRNPRNLSPPITRTFPPRQAQLPPAGYRFSAGRVGSWYHGRGYYLMRRRRRLPRVVPESDDDDDGVKDDGSNGHDGSDGHDDDNGGSFGFPMFGPDWQDPVVRLMFLQLFYPKVIEDLVRIAKSQAAPAASSRDFFSTFRQLQHELT